jgi:His-Xaa-Ser system protein HxsD
MTESTASSVEVIFDRMTVELDALQRAAYALAAMMTIDIRQVRDQWVCTLFPIDAAPDSVLLVSSLRREVLDQTLRLRIGRETEGVRNLILALAFSNTGLIDQAADE